MNEKELLPFCRYYKGENKNPFEGHPDDALPLLWSYERTWVHDTINGCKSGGNSALASYLDEYLSVGMREFYQTDNTPATLKATLFNRFAKGYNSMLDAVPDFKAFYKKYYR